MKLQHQSQLSAICAVATLTLSLVAGCSSQPTRTQSPANNASAAATRQATPAPSPAVKLDVPYVPTPDDVVAEMLRVANVSKDDLLYDLGSGDGRIVITAAKKFGTRGVGVDINPQRIKESNENAQKAGIANRVKFIQGDLFATDLTGATVVTLYLLPDVNLKLRPKLLRELKPGTRVVSHNYDMGDWQPEKTIEVGDHFVYYWVVPERTPSKNQTGGIRQEAGRKEADGRSRRQESQRRGSFILCLQFFSNDAHDHELPPAPASCSCLPPPV